MKQISIEDRELLIRQSGCIRNSEYQFSTLFIWQKTYNFQYVIIEGAICIFGYQHDGTLQCYFPLGSPEKLPFIIEKTINTFHDLGYRFNFRPLSERMRDSIINCLQFDYTSGSKDSYSDYLYDYRRLSTLAGNDYRNKRKEINRFLARYNYQYETITSINQEECLRALIRIITVDPDFDTEEIEAYKRAFHFYNQLNLRGGCIRIDGIIEAVAVGESIGDMVLMHIRRANKRFIGIYPVILYFLLNNEFTDHDYTIVNTQDDMGNEAIRKAKLSYKPTEVVKKYYIKEK